MRDEASRAAIERIADTSVSVAPDTVFGIARFLNLAGAPSAEFTQLCQAAGLEGPYIVLQAAPDVEGFVRFIKNHPQRFRSFQFLVLPISPVLGDRQEIIDADPPRIVGLPIWPSPLVIAELIARAEAVVGLSYHLTITALVAGVPVFRPQNRFDGKYFALRQFETIFELPVDGEPDPDWFLARVGRTTPSAAVRATSPLLTEHWDRIAAAIRVGPEPAPPSLDRFWQSLPALLEDAAKRENEAVTALAEQRAESGRLLEALTWARTETGIREARVAEILSSISWRLTAPLRLVGRPLWRRKPRLINLGRIRNHRLETDPYHWAAITDLFHSRDAAKLVSTYPCDHFKLVAAYGGDRTYEYEARSLIGMGAGVISFPDDLSDVWRRLASDFLSPGYRAAMTALTGQDLSSAPMEVNVFHYGPGGSLDAHRDLPEKLATHVLYFNDSWNNADGGCLRILRSADTGDLVAEILPVVENSAVIVRSEKSWHCVSRVIATPTSSRRSITVTFYRPGSVSTMWPPGDTTPLHRYEGLDLTRRAEGV